METVDWGSTRQEEGRGLTEENLYGQLGTSTHSSLYYERVNRAGE